MLQYLGQHLVVLAFANRSPACSVPRYSPRTSTATTTHICRPFYASLTFAHNQEGKKMWLSHSYCLIAGVLPVSTSTSSFPGLKPQMPCRQLYSPMLLVYLPATSTQKAMRAK
ncbi:hypothetical protein EDD18DRAFT_663880 [Armillaria luteobubalina]|uniref:Uncharacterized protein n=1 Tax=Armillaria luteobubalina TaxID=153913 RepID=A0AA39PN39_9AGAR|nr:hypothetical protein EDD18DRAFT_663880 [Armillaria luteobubalina]